MYHERMVVGEFTIETELAIIGGGPGGYTAAFRAAELGVQTMVIDERDELGGVCLHAGCIPSKTLLHIAEAIHTGEEAAQFGVCFDRPRIDLEKMRAWVNKSRATLAKGLTSTAKKHGVEFVQGRANFEDSRRLTVVGGEGGTARIRFRRAIIATGARSRPHPVLPFDGKRVITAAEALELPIDQCGSTNCRVLIVGNNYNAIELACIYSAIGCAATLITRSDRMLPDADDDLSRPLLRRVKERAEHFATQVQVESASESNGRLDIAFNGADSPKRTDFDLVIIASEPMPNVDGLALEKTGVRLDEEGFISVNPQQQTADPRILAVGDVTGRPMLADHAMLEARVAAEVVAGWNSSVDRRAVAFVMFTDPQLAWCGLTEHQARADGIEHRVIKIPWGASGRAVGMGRTDGVTKIIFDPDTKLILGIGITGVGAAELIAEGVLAIEMGAVLDDLAGAIHPHPTLSELISVAAGRVEDSDEF